MQRENQACIYMHSLNIRLRCRDSFVWSGICWRLDLVKIILLRWRHKLLTDQSKALWKESNRVSWFCNSFMHWEALWHEQNKTLRSWLGKWRINKISQTFSAEQVQSCYKTFWRKCIIYNAFYIRVSILYAVR